MHRVQVAGARISALMHICNESTVTLEAVNDHRSHTKLVLSTHAFSKLWRNKDMQMKYDLLHLLRDEKAFEIGAVRRQCEMKVTDFIRKPKLGIYS